MRLRERISRDLKFIRGLRRTLRRVKTIASDSTNLSCDDLEEAVDRWRERTAVTFEGGSVTYGEFDQIANRYAHWARGQNLRRGATVALFMPNRLEYPAIWYGLSKVGVAAALINNQLTGAALRHCLDVSGATHVLVDGDTLPMLEAVRGELARNMVVWTLSTAHGDLRDLGKALKSCSQLRPDRAQREGMTAKETCVYIFTSGTTGLPKAARMSHMRFLNAGEMMTGLMEFGADDVFYCVLPLYHGAGGMVVPSVALATGRPFVLRRRFSRSGFWPDVRRHRITAVYYIGEIVRYLLAAPPAPADRDHSLRVMTGAGLKPDLWEAFADRFGVDAIIEGLGSTEANYGITNVDGRPGSVGRLPYPRATNI
ncbi:MAG TPA: AMP-binding protein, partial [Caulobacteraceae bacterium]|nr:AMP-binding protein [Caulobacteraceae bacterium]